MSSLRTVLLSALSAFLAVSALGQEPVLQGRCVGCHDGDTITVLVAQYVQVKVRLAWIDAPEMHQAFGSRAKQAMSELVLGKDVVLQPHTIDRSGRLVARVLVDGQDAALSYLSKVFAGSTKKMSVRRLRWSKPVTVMPKTQRKLKRPASGKTLIRCRPGIGAKKKIQHCGYNRLILLLAGVQ